MSDDAQLKEALFDFHQYISDRIAPLMFADSIEVLLRYPAELLAAEIRAWVAQQQLSAPASDYLFHAVKKVWLMGDFDLVPKDALSAYVADLRKSVLQYCPAQDRELLRENLERLGSAPAGPIATPLDVLHRQDGGSQIPAATKAADATLSREEVVGLRRLSVFLTRLQPQALGMTPEHRGEVASQFMTAAAAQSSTALELEQHLGPLRELGFETGTDMVFRTLAQSLPGWGSLPSAQGAAPAPQAGQLDAMQRVVSLAEDPAEAAKRFRELVHTAIAQFNEGHLGRAVPMFELAEQLAVDKVQALYVDALRKGGAEYLQPERLRKLADRGDSRVDLRKIMNFFFALRTDALLGALNGEPRRERRHELLALLEAHGPAARAQAWELLKTSVDAPAADVDPFFQMNLIYLLRVIARPEDANVEEEVAVVMRTSGRASPPPLIKQVIAHLAATRHEKAERALITYLRVFENMLLQPETAVYEHADIEVLLDRTCAGLVRYGSPRAWRALVDHGLKPEARLGSTMSRLAEAGRQDLSGSMDIVERLIAALKAELPRTILGVKVRASDERILCLIRALSGTPADPVREALQQIVNEFPGQRIAEAASKALSSLSAASKPAESVGGLSGDLELFGLPALLQTLSQSRLTGVLNLMVSQGKPEATLLFEQGQLRGAQLGNIRGEDAVYQLFEKPFNGTFAFLGKQDLASLGPLSPPQEVIGLILEGARRHDEWKRAAALVPDQVTLTTTGTPSTPLEDEDEDFVRLVWSKASSGSAKPADCEAAISTDAYRVRRLIAHWVEEGALGAA